MKCSLTLLAVILFSTSFSQVTINSGRFGELTFKQLGYGLAEVKEGTTDELANSPSGSHGWLDDFQIVHTSDSIKVRPKANFGVVYVIDAKDTVDIPVSIEWIYPKKIKNDKGESFKSIKYTTQRPTNIPSASSYSLDEPYEMVKGKWTVNLYIEDKKVCSKTFILY